ncbi:MAG: ATP synthase F1 subunit gamma [Marinilabiliales bacterium]
MASLKELRTRIKSVISTRQITNAMKMVSAARLKKAQDAIIRIRPYAGKLHEILSHLAGSTNVMEDNIYSQVREPNKILLVVFASNRGLCGSFNSNIAKQTIKTINEKYSEQHKAGNVDIITIGKKAEDLLKKKYKISDKKHEVFNELNFSNAAYIAENILKKFANKEYDRVELIYNRFKNAAVQILTTEQFLPIEIDETTDQKTHYDYIFEPSKEYIVQDLIPKSLKVQFFKALLDTNAAEHGARMTAMHKATDNATELLGELRLQYNKARQSAITLEILEIVSGAEALKG